METKRKLQIGAAAVIANGLVALTVMSPRPALANPCSPKTVCGWPSATCAANAHTVCVNNAPPGCTVTSATCSGICAVIPPGNLPISYVVCRFD
jgi:hypothetical protein